MSDTPRIDDGGPAFPIPSDGLTFGTHLGMTLRDYFAAKAMPTVWGYSSKFTLPVSQVAIEACGGNPEKVAALVKGVALADFYASMDEMIARESYRIADAMLRARKEPPHA